jgi:TonB-dependent receptor
MNTLDITHRLRLVAGVRFEATHVDTQSAGGSDYLDVLPSVALRIGLKRDSALRLVFSRGLSRPDPQDIAQSSSLLDTTQTPNTITLGNANLKAEHSNNYDVLFEQYLNPVGLLQAGFFYKQLSDPIVNGQFAENPALFASQSPTSPYVLVSQVQNIGSAHVLGFEIGYQQRLRFLPGVLKGAGLSANYSYTTSETSGLQALLRDDSPALLRQAPHTWNISPTFDTRRVSMRVGMTYNSAMIFAYQFQDLQPGTNGIVPISPADLSAGGAKGPGGDNYLYSHFQLDVQGSYRITHKLSVFAYGLNVNNEVFGFYNGSPQYVVQREYYKPTVAVGLRWSSAGESKIQ